MFTVHISHGMRIYGTHKDRGQNIHTHAESKNEMNNTVTLWNNFIERIPTTTRTEKQKF
jgi:hypothetical protein